MNLTQTQSPSKVGIAVGIVVENSADRAARTEMMKVMTTLKQFGISGEFVSGRMAMNSKHRFACWKVLIVGTRRSSTLAEDLAKHWRVPVIRVPLSSGRIQAEALVRTLLVRPIGAGVATVALNGTVNAAILAAQMIGAAGNPERLNRVRRYKQELRRMVLRRKKI